MTVFVSNVMTVADASKSAFRVWGRIDGHKFDQVFPNVAEWRAERRMIERVSSVLVIGMASVEAQ